MRAALKHATEIVLLRGGPASIARMLNRAGSLILAYHNVVPRGDSATGDTSLHLDQELFAAQLDELSRTHDVVPLPSLLEARTRGNRPRAAITFDDAYRGATTTGVEELAARALPATIFVAPAFVGGRPFWWDVLADPRTGTVPETLRRRGLEECRGRDREVLAWAGSESLPTSVPPPHATGSTVEELEYAASVPGITLASHTWSHPNLTRLTRDEMHAELTRPLAWLRERFANVLPWLSYPYGLSAPAVETEAARAGYRAALLVSGGWISERSPSDYALPRLNVPAGLSMRGFRLRTAGLLAS